MSDLDNLFGTKQGDNLAAPADKKKTWKQHLKTWFLRFFLLYTIASVFYLTAILLDKLLP